MLNLRLLNGPKRIQSLQRSVRGGVYLVYMGFAQLAPGIGVPSLSNPPANSNHSPPYRSQIDEYLLSKVSKLASSYGKAFYDPSFTSEKSLFEQYENNRGKELQLYLDAESRPSLGRRIGVGNESDARKVGCPISLVAHISSASDLMDKNAKVCVASGFKLNVHDGSGLRPEYWLSCAHSLEVGSVKTVIQRSNALSGCFINWTVTCSS